jgi:hypothetical protein
MVLYFPKEHNLAIKTLSGRRMARNEWLYKLAFCFLFNATASQSHKVHARCFIYVETFWSKRMNTLHTKMSKPGEPASM